MISKIPTRTMPYGRIFPQVMVKPLIAPTIMLKQQRNVIQVALSLTGDMVKQILVYQILQHLKIIAPTKPIITKTTVWQRNVKFWELKNLAYGQMDVNGYVMTSQAFHPRICRCLVKQYHNIIIALMEPQVVLIQNSMEVAMDSQSIIAVLAAKTHRQHLFQKIQIAHTAYAPIKRKTAIRQLLLATVDRLIP